MTPPIKDKEKKCPCGRNIPESLCSFKPSKQDKQIKDGCACHDSTYRLDLIVHHKGNCHRKDFDKCDVCHFKDIEEKVPTDAILMCSCGEIRPDRGYHKCAKHSKQDEESWEINEMYLRIKPLVEKMRAKYPKELNMEGLEPALTNDIAEIVIEFTKPLLSQVREEAYKKAIELFSKKTMNEKGKPICPKCGKDMERDVQEPQGHLWFCKCSPSLRLSVG